MTPSSSHAQRALFPRGRALALVALGGWAVAAFVVTTSLATAHYALPRPLYGDRHLSYFSASLRERGDTHWLAIHTLLAQCGCSKRIVAHLATRGPLAGVTERVVMIGHDQALEQQLTAAGFALTPRTPKALKDRYGIVSVPLLIVADPADRVAYSGGYTERQQGPDLRDVAIIRRATTRVPQAALPLFGCATSRSLQRLLDPFALKYGAAVDGDAR